MDHINLQIINGMQGDFPICPRPFAVTADKLRMEETLLIERLSSLLEDGSLTRFGPFFNAELLGGGLTLAAMRVPQKDFDDVVAKINAQPEIAHNYARDHELNMWFVVATERKEQIKDVLVRLESLTGYSVFDLPKLKEFRLGFQIYIDENGQIDTKALPNRGDFSNNSSEVEVLDALDRAIIAATQEGLPLLHEPYQDVAKTVGADEDTVLDHLQKMFVSGKIRRIGVATNHYRLGLKGNGMSVWDFPDDKVIQLGEKIGALDYVTHCYLRPRHLPTWPYNLFVMVHGPDRDTVEKKVAAIAQSVQNDNRGHRVLHSTRILKKTGLRLRTTGDQ